LKVAWGLLRRAKDKAKRCQTEGAVMQNGRSDRVVACREHAVYCFDVLVGHFGDDEEVPIPHFPDAKW
jgi:hypothetical protein